MVMPSSMPPVPRLLRGSVVVRRRRCGKPNCRCADGQQLHEAPALSYSDRGRTKIVLLDDGDVAAVTAAVDRYRAAAAELDAAAGAGVAALETRVAGQRAAGRRRRGR